jgi:PKD repeat protein
MKKNITRFFLAILLLGTATATFAQQTYYYDFRNNFNENSGSGPVLNVLGTGAFTDVPLPELSCLSRTVYGFTQNSGVQFDNTAAGNFVTETYSVEMYFEFLNNSGFKRIIDFKNQTSDFGLYCTAGELQFYDGITIPTTAFVANQYVHLVVTRDSASEEVNLYVDGALLGTFVDSTQLGVLDASNVMNFFQDDLVFGGEARPGNIALLKIYNTVIDGAAVNANFNDLEKTSAAVAFTPDITSACLNGNVFNFTNTSTTTSTVTYNWTFGDGGVATTNNTTYNYTTSGNFTVTLTADDGAGCIDSVSASVTLFDNPVVNLGADTTFCDGFVLTLNAGDGFSSYIWQDGTTDSTYVVTTGGQYSVLVSDDNNCTAVDEIDIVVAALPVVELGSDTTLCFGSSLPLSGPAGMGSYLWSTGETTEIILVNASETYFLTVVDFGGCTNTDSIVVDILPELIISLGADTAFCDGNSVTLDPGASFQSYLWSDGSTDPTLFVSASGTYAVTVLQILVVQLLIQ